MGCLKVFVSDQEIHNSCTASPDTTKKRTIGVGEVRILFLLLLFLDTCYVGCNLGGAEVGTVEHLTMLG